VCRYAAVAREMLLTQASSFSKGLLSEILEFVMGTGLIPADGTGLSLAYEYNRPLFKASSQLF
jgi:hypothetical protein